MEQNQKLIIDQTLVHEIFTMGELHAKTALLMILNGATHDYAIEFVRRLVAEKREG